MEVNDSRTIYKLVNARHGQFLVNPLDTYIGKAIDVYGEYCEIEWLLLEQVLFNGKDAVEVGANIGTHTVAIANKLAKMGRRLLAIEPQPVVFQNMCANVALNGLLNVLTENCACSGKSGKLAFQAPDYRHENNSGGVSMSDEGEGNQTIRAIPLDDLIPPDFDVGLIKIDVEGFEQKVLEGATKTLARFRPTIYVENDRLEMSKGLIECLWGIEYNLWWHTPTLFNPNNFFGVSEDIYSNLASFNMLAFPKEISIETNGLIPVEDAGAHPLKTAEQ